MTFARIAAIALTLTIAAAFTTDASAGGKGKYHSGYSSSTSGYYTQSQFQPSQYSGDSYTQQSWSNPSKYNGGYQNNFGGGYSSQYNGGYQGSYQQYVPCYPSQTFQPYPNTTYFYFGR